MPPVARCHLAAILLLCVAQAESAGLQIENRGGIHASPASRMMRWGGPNLVSYQDWTIETNGPIEAYFDRVLVKERKYYLRPELRSAVITTRAILRHKGVPVLIAPHLIWLQKDKTLHVKGSGIHYYNGTDWLLSSGDQASIRISRSGRITLEGSWTKSKEPVFLAPGTNRN